MSRSLAFLALLACHGVAPQSSFDIPSEDVVYQSLERFESEKGQQFISASRERRTSYEPMLGDKIAAAGMPEELIAVVLVESGFQNIEARPPELPGGGLWQFIASTGRLYGLKIDEQVDERLDPALSTDAALALLSDLHREFGDWGLALAAYNVGSRAVSKAIQEEGTSDCWELIRRGALPTYAADVMAGAVLLEASPE